MSITIYDFSGRHEAYTLSALKEILCKRYGPNVNGFWISHDDQQRPVISLLVKEDLATLIYFPSEDHPGFIPVGGIEGLSGTDCTTFRGDTIEQGLEVPNSQVIQFASALNVAEEFFKSKSLPKSIDWTEL